MTEDDEKATDSRGIGFPQILHDRARTAGEELHRLLLSLSTGAVGVFFISLTSKMDPPMTSIQQVIVSIALVFMGVAGLAGVASWYYDSRRNYFWAKAIQAEQRSEKNVIYRKKSKAEIRSRILARILVVGFSGGVVASLAYIGLRILAL